MSDATLTPEFRKSTPRRLPVGIADFAELVADLKAEYGELLPTQDDDSLSFVIATSIMHMGPSDSFKTLEYFYNLIVAGASKQVAHHVFQTIKLKQEAALKAAKEAEAELNKNVIPLTTA
jgi:hypothetical protein